jgi:hypothetical protein
MMPALGEQDPSHHNPSLVPNPGLINVIAGGIVAKSKRTRTEQELCAQVTSMSDVILSFTKADLPVGKIRENESLVIIAMIDGFEIHRIFVDQGKSVDIIFWSLFKK